jgi:hypothetical protein
MEYLAKIAEYTASVAVIRPEILQNQSAFVIPTGPWLQEAAGERKKHEQFRIFLHVHHRSDWDTEIRHGAPEI